MTTITIVLLVITLIAGLYMTWSIGANDVANAIGTSVGSGALTLKQAVVVAAVLEFCGAFFFGSHVTQTIEEGVVNSQFFQSDPIILVYGMLAVLLAAGTWLFLASYFGLPVSTTHSIVGAMVGFGMAVGGMHAVYWGNVGYIASSWIASPLIGGLLSYCFFYFLRTKIFFASNPIRATQKFTPYIVFTFLFVFSVVFLFQDLEQFDYSPTFFKSAITAASISLIGFLITKYWLSDLTKYESSSRETFHHPDLAREISKAKRYLYKLQSYSRGTIQDKLTDIVDQFDTISGELSKKAVEEIQVPEFMVIERVFSRLQIMSACMMAFSHGANDVANAIGPLSVAVNVLLHGSFVPDNQVSLWLLALGGFGIVMGLATWGWRVVETIGRKITELTPTRGFSAEFGAAATILIASRMGFPISATHTLVGSVLGVGFARGIEALNLTTIRDIVVSWLITIPVGASTAVVFFYAISAIFS
ncbi:MAG: Low-affinity inorganic phosphate transporter 1 [Chlamydiae bacterium]|nr:Low-affinity inorganic phosphate transporter 1 [Chlamydiota bacterium]